MIVVQYIYYYILRLTGQCSTILLDNTTIHRASFPTFSCCHGSKGGKKKKECKMCHEDGTLRARRFFRTASGSSTYLDESSSRTRRRRLKGNHPLLPANSTASIPSELVKRGGGEVNIRESNVLL